MLPALPHSPGCPALEVLAAGPGPGLVILLPRKGPLGLSQGQVILLNPVSWGSPGGNSGLLLVHQQSPL